MERGIKHWDPWEEAGPVAGVGWGTWELLGRNQVPLPQSLGMLQPPKPVPTSRARRTQQHPQVLPGPHPITLHPSTSRSPQSPERFRNPSFISDRKQPTRKNKKKTKNRNKKTKTTTPKTPKTPKNEKRPHIRTSPCPCGCYIQAGGSGACGAPRPRARSGSSQGGSAQSASSRRSGMSPTGTGRGSGGVESSPWQPSPCKRSRL